MHDLPRPPKVDARVAGTFRVETTRFKRILGASTFAVWVALVWRRDPDGSTRVRNSTIAADRQLSAWAVNRATQRLRAAGLLDGDSWAGAALSKRYPRRRVLGDYRDGLVTIPKSTWVKLMNLPVNGGARSGAGRPARNQNAKAENQNAKPEEIRTPRHRDRIEREISSSSEEEIPAVAGAARAGLRILRDKDARSIRFGATPPRDPFIPPPRGVHDLIPPYPSNVCVGAARMRSPPPLNLDMTKTERVWRMIKAYRAAVDRTYGGDSFVFANVKDIRASRFFAPLVAASLKLIEHQITPIPWACWSVEFWHAGEHRQAKKAPPITYVYSVPRIEERHGWFGREAGAFEGGRVFLSELHRKFLRAYKAMVAEMMRTLPAETETAAIRAIVARYFPRGWTDQLEAIREDYRETQSALDRTVARGDWVIGL